MVGRIIETEACVAEGAAWLAQAEPRFAHALSLTGQPPLRRRANCLQLALRLMSKVMLKPMSALPKPSLWPQSKRR